VGEALNNQTRPPHMPDLEWESIGLLCLVQLSEHSERMLKTNDPLDSEVGFVYFEMLLKQMVNWFVADRKHKEEPIDEKAFETRAVALGEMMLKMRGELGRG
jgi:hypothetical protein